MADKSKWETIFEKLLDIITIVFPAVVAVIGVLGLKNQAEVVSVVEMVYRILEIALGAGASIASIIYNFVHDKK